MSKVTSLLDLICKYQDNYVLQLLYQSDIIKIHYTNENLYTYKCSLWFESNKVPIITKKFLSEVLDMLEYSDWRRMVTVFVFSTVELDSYDCITCCESPHSTRAILDIMQTTLYILSD